MKNFEIIELVRNINLHKVDFLNVSQDDMVEQLERFTILEGKFVPGVYAVAYDKNDLNFVPDVVAKNPHGETLYFLNISDDSAFQREIKLQKKWSWFDNNRNHTETTIVFYCS